MASIASSSSPTTTDGGSSRVVADALADVGDDQPLARREQRLEEDVAVVVARRAVAGLRRARPCGRSRAAGGARGKAPSFMPTRHTTRNGMLRIGTSSQKRDRAGEQAARRAVASSARSSSAAHRRELDRAVEAAGAPRARRAAASAAATARCWYGVAGVAAPATASSAPSSVAPLDRRGAARAAPRGSGNSVSHELASWPSSSASAALDVVDGSTPRTAPRRRPASRSRAAGDRGRSARCCRRSRGWPSSARCAASTPQRMPASATQRRTRSSSSARDAEARAHRRRARAGRARRAPAAGRRSSSSARRNASTTSCVRARPAIGDAVRDARPAGAAEHGLDHRRVGVDRRRHHHDVVRLAASDRERRAPAADRAAPRPRASAPWQAWTAIESSPARERERRGAARRAAVAQRRGCRTAACAAATSCAGIDVEVARIVLVVDPRSRAPPGTRARRGRARRAADGPRRVERAQRRRSSAARAVRASADRLAARRASSPSTRATG